MSKKILIIFFSLFFFSIANAEDVFLSLSYVAATNVLLDLSSMICAEIFLEDL